jgi:aspartyl-tRNA(Asn)/glutamyl-tRNA(Gln) amidotransferase subunit C
MPVDARTVEAAAALARLWLAGPEGSAALGKAAGRGNRAGQGAQGDQAGPDARDAETAKLAKEFSDIVGYMDILNECDTSGVEPLYSPMIDPQPPRADVPREAAEGASDWILEGAPETFGRFFCVPKVL